jgi:hemolysin D
MVIFEIDIVTSAHGKIIPEGKIKTIQPLFGGQILGIHVQEGELVEVNTPLISLDPTQYKNDLNATSTELALLERKISRIKTLITILEQEDFEIPDQITDIGLYNEIFSFKEQVKELNNSLEANQIELSMINSQIVTSRKNIKYIEDKITTTKKLVHMVVPKTNLLKLENELENLLHENEKYSYLYNVKQQNIKILQSKIDQLKSDILSKNYYELDNLEKNKTLAIESLKKLRYTIDNLNIKSPTKGYVENLRTYTVRGVIAAGEALMNIIPLGTPIKLEANLHSRDIGFVKFGQKVAIKFDAFPYTQYGTLQGKVCKISNDSFSADNINYFYKIDICLEKDNLHIKGLSHKVKLGFTAQIDICTDRRKIIDFFLSPIKIALSNSFKEK